MLGKSFYVIFNIMLKRNKVYLEWLKQSEYDYATAKAMFKANRYIYVIFMCHLSLEKALKGLYVFFLNKNCPKTHDLNYLVKKIKLELPEKVELSLEILNALSVPTRYPEELDELLKQYSREKTEKILKQTRQVLICLKKKLPE